MKGKFQFAALLALALLAGLAAEPALAQRGRGQLQQGKRPPAEKKQGAQAQPAQGKAFMPGRGPGGAGSPPQFMERLRQMSPEEQERFLNNQQRFRNMSPQRQEQIRQNLRHWNSLTPEQQREMRAREQRWTQMTPEQQQHIRQDILPRWKSLEPSRRQPIMRRLRVLSGLSEEEREARLKDENFLSGLSTEDRDMLRELARLRLGGPQEPPPAEEPPAEKMSD